MDKGNSQAADVACAIQRCECCRSQLEAHSFSYKPVPTTDEDGMRFHVVLTQVSSGGAPATNRHNPYSINPGLLDPRRRGLNGCCMSGEFLLLVVNPAPQPLPKTPVFNQNFKLRTRGAAVEPPDICTLIRFTDGLLRSSPVKLLNVHNPRTKRGTPRRTTIPPAFGSLRYALRPCAEFILKPLLSGCLANHPGLHMPRAATSWASCLFAIDATNDNMKLRITQLKIA